MITIVTGAENSGKSSFLESWFDQGKQGLGALSVKRYKKGIFYGYNLMQLPEKEIIPLNCLVNANDQIGPETLINGPFIYYQTSFLWVEERLMPRICPGMKEPLWLDEIGKLELQEKGFNTLLRKAIDTHCELRFAVPETLLNDVIDKYKIQEAKIINL